MVARATTGRSLGGRSRPVCYNTTRSRMPPSIHPVHLVTVLRQKSLTPAIIFLTSRRSCDEALQAFEHATDPLPPARQENITAVLDELTAAYPSLQDHPLRKMVTACGVAA